jgi:hypothetical protein
MALPRRGRSEALDILENHIASAPYPTTAIAWRSFLTLVVRRLGPSPR